MENIRFKNNTITAVVNRIGYEEDDSYVLFIPSLDLVAYGDDLAEAEKEMEDVVHLFFKYIAEEKTVETALKELGWKKHKRFNSRYSSKEINPMAIMRKMGVSKFNVDANKELALAI